MRVQLGQNRDYITKGKADGIGIFFGEPQGQPAASWTLDVFADTPVGRMYVGTINTVPSAVGALVGGAPDRIIAHAYCMGARSWTIRATGPAAGTILDGLGNPGNVTAELKAFPVECCFGTATGIFPVSNRIVLNGGVGASVPMTNVRQEWAVPVRIQTVTAYNPSANPELWLMLFNLGPGPGPPAGAQPTNGLALDLMPGATGQFTFTPAQFFPLGLWLAVSTTPDTLTAPGAGADKIRIVTAAEF